MSYNGYNNNGNGASHHYHNRGYAPQKQQPVYRGDEDRIDNGYESSPPHPEATQHSGYYDANGYPVAGYDAGYEQYAGAASYLSPPTSSSSSSPSNPRAGFSNAQYAGIEYDDHYHRGPMREPHDTFPAPRIASSNPYYAEYDDEDDVQDFSAPTSRRAPIHKGPEAPQHPKHTYRLQCPDDPACPWGFDKKSDYDRHRMSLHSVPPPSGKNEWYCVHVGCNRFWGAEPRNPIKRKDQCRDHCERRCAYGITKKKDYDAKLTALEMGWEI